MCSESESDRLKLAFYDASDGPRIMLFGSNLCPISKLVDVFTSLSRSGGPFDLHALPFIDAYGGVKLSASTCGEMFQTTAFVGQGIRRIPSLSGHEFRWQRTLEGWDYLAWLLGAGLASNREPGHQYLTDYPREDAIVVVSRGEYGDDVLDGLTKDCYDDEEK